jgi:hypothetical protein
MLQVRARLRGTGRRFDQIGQVAAERHPHAPSQVSNVFPCWGRRRVEKADAQNLQRIPSARAIARMMTIGRDLLTKAETVSVAAIEAGVPTLVEARELSPNST